MKFFIAINNYDHTKFDTVLMSCQTFRERIVYLNDKMSVTQSLTLRVLFYQCRRAVTEAHNLHAFTPILQPSYVM
jgi:hypothetical protein